MEATELQIGNWVKLNDPLQIRLCPSYRILQWHDCNKIRNSFSKSKDRKYRSHPHHKKWLHKNGFKGFYNDICEFKYCTKEIDGYFVEIRVGLSNSGDDYVVCYIDNADRCSVANADIRFVHQMQNLLSIVGINWEVKI